MNPAIARLLRAPRSTVFRGLAAPFATDGCTYPWYTATTPNAVYYSGTNKTWFSWEAWDGSRRIIDVTTFNHTNGLWEPVVRVATTSLIDDDHGVPSMVRDHEGYWHIFYGAHQASMKHIVTSGVDDLTMWADQPVLTGTYTYPHPTLIGGALYVFMRASERYLALRKSSALSGGVATWGSEVVIADMDIEGSGPARWYGGNHVVIGSKIHMTATRGNEGNTWRRDIYYLVYDTATGNVENIDGSTITAAASLPIGLATLDASYKIVSQPTAAGTGYIPTMCLDAASRMHILYADGPTNNDDVVDVWHIMRSGSGWTSPHKLGTSRTALSGFAITPSANGSITAYWSQQNGTPAWYSGSGRRDGGDIWIASRASGGTWAISQMLHAATTFALGEPNLVLNGPSHLRAIWAENNQDSAVESGKLRMYAYGDFGFLPRPAGTTAPILAWSPSERATTIAITNAGLDASRTSQAIGSCRSSSPILPAEKRYFEVAIVTMTNADGTAIGLGSSSFVPAGHYTGDNSGGNSSIGYFGDGTVYRAGSNQGSIATYAAGDNIGVAVDMVNSKVWFRKNGGNWNNAAIGSQNPAANTGGYSISTLTTGGLTVYPACTFFAVGEKISGRFLATSWSYAAPSGFTELES